MISRLSGMVVHIDDKYIVLDVQGVGYKVFTSPDIFIKLDGKQDKKSPLTLWTYLAVREGALDLYGFLSISELKFFELLITISGIGPKTAMGILNVATVHSIEMAIQSGDTTHMTKVSGIGKKMAEKIVLELKDKIQETAGNAEHQEVMKNDADALEALKSLGYSPTEARDVLKGLPKTVTKTNDKIKEALKMLGK
jgi:Holliday junction DNA helicase RuvA